MSRPVGIEVICPLCKRAYLITRQEFDTFLDKDTPEAERKKWITLYCPDKMTHWDILETKKTQAAIVDIKASGDLMCLLPAERKDLHLKASKVIKAHRNGALSYKLAVRALKKIEGEAQ